MQGNPLLLSSTTQNTAMLGLSLSVFGIDNGCCFLGDKSQDVEAQAKRSEEHGRSALDDASGRVSGAVHDIRDKVCLHASEIGPECGHDCRDWHK